MSDIIINGGLRMKNRSVILTIYSFPFGRYLLKNGIDRLNIDFEEDRIMLSKGKNKKVSFERLKSDHPLCTMAISKIMPLDLKNKVMGAGKQTSINILIRDILTEEDLFNSNNAFNHLLPKERGNLNLDKKNFIKVGCFISCIKYGKNKDKSGSYRFSVRHKVIERVVKDRYKISLIRNGKDFFIIKDDRGMNMSSYKQKKGAALSYVQISKDFLLEEEKDLFSKGRWCVCRDAYVSMKEFGLNICDFFYDQQERELARALIEQGINISQPLMHKREGDILLPDIKGQVEVTKIKPVSGIGKKHKNNAHGGGVHINARLCEGFLRINKNEAGIFFVVLHEQWMEYGWVKKLYEKVKPGVILIPTDFEENWNLKAANKIKNELINKA